MARDSNVQHYAIPLQLSAGWRQANYGHGKYTVFAKDWD